MSLNNIRIVLIETSHPGNIGSVARAMLTMGITDLCLVNPRHFPDKQATIMASGAEHILQQARIVSSVQDAIADCTLVIGTSAREQRSVPWPLMSAREAGTFIAEHSTTGKTAILFGRESSGLTNKELESCQYLLSIPVNPDFRSLNIASAVQVIAYECAVALEQQPVNTQQRRELATAKDMQNYYRHLEKTLIDIRYMDPDKPRLLMRKLRCLYGRIQLTKSEVNLLRGILSAAQGIKFIPRNQRKPADDTRSLSED